MLEDGLPRVGPQDRESGPTAGLICRTPLGFDPADSLRSNFSSRTSLPQLMPAILHRLGDFAHPIRTRRNLVFKLDGRLDIPFVIPQQAQDLPDRRVPLAEGRVGAIMKLPIFQMHMRNPLVMPLDERDGGNIEKLNHRWTQMNTEEHRF